MSAIASRRFARGRGANAQLPPRRRRRRPRPPTVPGPAAARRSSQRRSPSGTEIDVRLQTTLNSDTAQVEQRFEATTMVDLYRGSEVLIPAGSIVRGVVSSVQRAGRSSGPAA
jgi:hypothetical protein